MPHVLRSDKCVAESLGHGVCTESFRDSISFKTDYTGPCVAAYTTVNI